MTFLKFKTTLALILTAFALSACITVNPATGKKEFTPFMTPSQETAIGAEQNPILVEQFGGAYNDAALQAYVERVGDRLAATSELPEIDFEFTVLNSPIINAFALPGGYVNISRELMAYFNDEAELAGVLGHEIGHVTARHSAQRYNTTIFTQLGAAAVGAVAGSDTISGIVNTGAQLALLSYSRGQESQSDGLGLRYMGRVGYDPEGSVRMLESLGAATNLEAEKRGVDPNATPNYARTHPLTSIRISDQKDRVAAIDPKPTNPFTNPNDYLDAIDGMLFGDDPAQGIVRGQDFLHPVLRLAFTAPNVFTLQNTARYVIGGAENGQFAFGGDGINSGTSTRAYLDQVWNGLFEGDAPQGLSNIRNTSAGGMEGVMGSARLDQETGSIDITVVAYRYDATHGYHFLLISKPEATSSYQSAYNSLIGSFRKMAAVEAATIKPLRIKIITVRSGDSISALASQMAVDDYKVELFKVLNGLEDGETFASASGLKLLLRGKIKDGVSKMTVRKKTNKEDDLFFEAREIPLNNVKNIERLLELTENKESLVRSEALERCENLYFKKAYKERILKKTLEGLSDPDDLVRVTCIENLTIWEHKAATKEIRKTLWDLDRLVRIYSAEALALFQDKKSISDLKRLLSNAESHFEEGACFFALYALGEKKYFEPLINIIHSDEHIAKIRFANVYVPKIVNKKNKGILLKLLQDAAKKEEPISVEGALEGAIQELKEMKFV